MLIYVLILCVIYSAVGAGTGLVLAFMVKAITGNFPRELVPSLAVAGAGFLPAYAGIARLRLRLNSYVTRKG